MNIYMYQAALWCEPCTLKVKEKLDREGKTPTDLENENSYDSDNYPKGPYDSDHDEADGPQHCDGCGLFLENNLTFDGYDILCRDLAESLHSGNISPTMLEWVTFYDLRLSDVIGHRCGIWPKDNAPIPH